MSAAPAPQLRDPDAVQRFEEKRAMARAWFRVPALAKRNQRKRKCGLMLKLMKPGNGDTGAGEGQCGPSGPAACRTTSRPDLHLVREDDGGPDG